MLPWLIWLMIGLYIINYEDTGEDNTEALFNPVAIITGTVIACISTIYKTVGIYKMMQYAITCAWLFVGVIVAIAITKITCAIIRYNRELKNE